MRRTSLLALVGTCLFGAGSLEGQTVTLDCAASQCHTVPLARGSGGFVGRARFHAEPVEALLTCRGTGTTKAVMRELVPGRGGLVSLLFGVDDGTAEAMVCEPGEDATLDIRGLTDGGWYWLDDEANSAVAPLLSKDVLDNRKVFPVNPGSPDILIEANRSGTASFVKQFSTGRVGVLSHVLPAPEREVVPCGPVVEDEAEDGSPRYVTRETGCAMGDGGTTVGLHAYAAVGRAAVRGGRVTRPVSGTSRVAVSLWLNGTGSVVHGDPANYPPTFGWPGIEGARPLRAEWEAVLVGSGPQASLGSAGIELTDSGRPDADGYAHLVLGPHDGYCPSSGDQHSARVRVRAARTTDTSGQPWNPVRPRIRHLDDLDGAAAEASFDVVCPQRASSAAGAGPKKGRDLVSPPAPNQR